MSDTAATPIVVDIHAPSGHTIMAGSQTAVREGVKNYLTGMLSGLGIPVAPELHWQTRPPGDNSVGAVINGQAARLRHSTTHSQGAKPADFALALCEDLLRNRHLLINDELVARATRLAPPSFGQFVEKDRFRILQCLFEQGFGLDRLADFVPEEGASPQTPEAWVETCIAPLQATQFLMYAHASQIDPDGDPYDFNRLVEGADYFVDVAFKIKGVPFPKMRCVKRADFAPDELAFQLNDLIFPVRRMADVNTENLRFVNFLTSNGALFLNRGSVGMLLDSLEAANPNLLALARSRFSVDFITTILRHLVAENISIRPLVRILEILVSGGQDLYRQQTGISEAPPLSEIVHLVADEKQPAQLDLADWSELVRINLKNAIINRALPHFEAPNTLSCFYLDNALQEKIARFDTFDADRQQAIRQTLHRHIAENALTPAGKIRPLISAAAARRRLTSLIAFEFPEIPVFSLQECLPRIVARYDVMIAE